MSYTAKLVAKLSCFCGLVAERCGIGGAESPVDKTGADELKDGFWKMADDLWFPSEEVLAFDELEGGSGSSLRSFTSLEP